MVRLVDLQHTRVGPLGMLLPTNNVCSSSGDVCNPKKSLKKMFLTPTFLSQQKYVPPKMFDPTVVKEA